MRECAMTCVICGDAFIAGHRSALYCPTCRVEQKKKHEKERYQEYYAGVRTTKNDKTEKKCYPSLTEIALKAKEAHMTYGEYVAKMESGGVT